MLASWWGTHKDNIVDWKEYHRMMRLSFGSTTTWFSKKYTGKDDSQEHMAQRTMAWGEVPQPERVHIFIHSLDVIPTNWYLETKLGHEIVDWDEMKASFLLTFIFEDGFKSIDGKLTL